MSEAQRHPGFAYRAGSTPAAPLRLTPLSQIYTKSVDTSKLSVTSILTYPTEDRAGDVVRPDGGDWTAHKAQPWVGLEHLRWHATEPNSAGLLGQRGIGNEPVVVAWARESLSRPGAPHAVQLKAIPLDGGTWHLPVGTSYFDPSDRLSMQTFRLVEEDMLPGVSLEFRPELKARRVRHAKSFLENRPAYDFGAWHGLSWVHCAIPVNPGATVCKSLLAATDKLASVVGAGRIGSERLHPVLFKALSRYVPETTRTVVHVEKAMPDMNDQTPETLYDAADTNGDGAVDSQDSGSADPSGDGRPLNGVEALYQKVMRLESSCEELEGDMQSSDSVELRGIARKACAKLKKIAAWIKGKADKHDAKLSGKADQMGADEDMDDDDEDEAEDTSSPEEGDDGADMEKDDDGAFKSVRAAYKPRQRAYFKALLASRVVRISKAQVQAAPTVEAQPSPAVPAPVAPPPEDLEYLKAAQEAEALADKELRRARKRYA